MMQGVYYKEWSAVMGREMEFKVYGKSGVPVLALPARGGRFYDWENSGMPDAAARLLNEGKLQLFCADTVDGEGLLAADSPLRRRAEMQEKYFVYLTRELAPRILALNGKAKAKSAEPVRLWCVGVDTGAYQAVNCRLRRPDIFGGAIGLSGVYDTSRFWGDGRADDLILRNSPLLALNAGDIIDTAALAAAADENALLLCSGQGAYEDDALADTKALGDALQNAGVAAHIELWGGDVNHDWYWWGKQWGMFAERLFA